MIGSADQPQFRSSRYNFWVPLSEGGILFNARGGAAMRVAGDDATALSRMLAGPPQDVDCAMLPDSLFAELRRGGFLIEPDEDVAAIGSGGAFAMSAAVALMRHTSLGARRIAEEAMAIAARTCIYTNDKINYEELG